MQDTILITGGTSGLGLAAATYLAKQHNRPRVLVASRRLPSETTLPKGVEFVPLDLASSSAVRNFVETWTAGPVSALILNAGLQFTKLQYSDGVETTFAINHVGHALLFFLFKQKNLLRDKCSIVVTASGTHDPTQKTGMTEPLYINAEQVAAPMDKKYLDDGRQRYTTSKLCNVMWTYALARRLAGKGKGWTVNAFDPGFMPGTGLARDYPPVLRFIFEQVMPHLLWLLRLVTGSKNIHTTAKSGTALAKLATGADFSGTSGKYFEGETAIDSSVTSYEVEKQEDLWTWTLEHVALNAQEKKAFGSF